MQTVLTVIHSYVQIRTMHLNLFLVSLMYSSKQNTFFMYLHIATIEVELLQLLLLFTFLFLSLLSHLCQLTKFHSVESITKTTTKYIHYKYSSATNTKSKISCYYAQKKSFFVIPHQTINLMCSIICYGKCFSYFLPNNLWNVLMYQVTNN